MSAGSIVGGGIQALGAIQSGQDTSTLLDNQARLQKANAAQALTAAKFNADRQSVIATNHFGAMTAGYGASGVDMSSGSVLATIAASAANAEMDRQNILHGGDIRATNFENQAALDDLGSKHALQASYFNAIGSIFGAGARGYAQSYGDNPSAPGGGDTAASVPTQETAVGRQQYLTPDGF